VHVEVKGTETVIGDVLAWVSFVGVGVLGLASCALATVHTCRFVVRRGGSAVVAATVAVIVAVFTFLGLWIVVDLYWLGRWGARRLGRRSISPA
jgi:hypothetical protein